jgi:hypothetical protein
MTGSGASAAVAMANRRNESGLIDCPAIMLLPARPARTTKSQRIFRRMIEIINQS